MRWIAAKTTGSFLERSKFSSLSTDMSYSCGCEQLNEASSAWHEIPPTASFQLPYRKAYPFFGDATGWLYIQPMLRSATGSPLRSGSTDTPSKAQSFWSAGRSRSSTSMIVAMKSMVTTGFQDSRAGPERRPPPVRDGGCGASSAHRPGRGVG